MVLSMTSTLVSVRQVVEERQPDQAAPSRSELGSGRSRAEPSSHGRLVERNVVKGRDDPMLPS